MNKFNQKYIKLCKRVYEFSILLYFKLTRVTPNAKKQHFKLITQKIVFKTTISYMK